MFSLRWAVAVALGLGLVACGPTPAAPPPASEIKPAAPAPAAAPTGPEIDPFYTKPEQFGVEVPKTLGGTFRMAGNQGSDQLDPYVGTLFVHQIIGEFVYDHIVDKRYAPNLNPLDPVTMCRLCTKWEQTDPKTYVFQLRQNVKWHDGKPFSGEDIKFSLERMADPKGGYNNRTNVLTLDKVEVSDPFTVKVTTNIPDADFLWKLFEVFIIPKHVFDGGGSLTKQMVGTGPFKLKSYDQTTKAVYEKNKDYYVDGRPYLDGWEINFIPDKSTRLASLVAGQIDFHTVNDKAEAEPLLRRNPNLQVQSFQATLGNSLHMRQDKPPYNDIRLRKAIHLAVDRQAMNQTLAFGGGIAVEAPKTSKFRPWSLPEEELLKLPGWRQPKDADIADAKRLLAELGFAGGFKTTGMTSATNSSTPQMLEALAGQLRTVGIDMEVQLQEPGVANKRYADGEFETVVWPSNAWMAPNRNYFDVRTGSPSNFYGISDPDLDKLIDQQAGLADKEQRYKVLRQIQQTLIDKMYVVPLIELNPQSIWQPWLHNWRDQTRLAQPYVYGPIAEVLWLDKH